MKAKKSESANLENKKRTFLQLGLLVSISFVLVAFEWSSNDIVKIDFSSQLNEELSPEIINEVKVVRPNISKPISSKPIIVKDPAEVIVSKEKLEKIEKESFKDVEPIDASDFIEDEEKEEVIETVKPTVIPATYNAGNPFFNGILPHYQECEGLSSDEMFSCISEQINERFSPEMENVKSLNYTGSKQVTVIFTVDETGAVSEVYIHAEKKFEKDLVKEIRRAVFNLPKMIPGSQGNSPIKARFTLPINFQIQ